jgi:hypothetical protein
MRRLFFTLTLLLSTAVAWAQPPGAPQPSATDEFVPLSSLPPVEQVPAAPLLIGAYAFFLVLMMFYLWTIWQRLGKVEKEMADLSRRQAGGR